jgi:hypothetical protein
MQDLECWILLFDSIHHVIAAEDVFHASNLWCDLVPVPRELSSNCGMALAFRVQEIDTARRILAEGQIALRRVFRPSSTGYVEETDLFVLNHG